jgi:hypothetical protein
LIIFCYFAESVNDLQKQARCYRLDDFMQLTAPLLLPNVTAVSVAATTSSTSSTSNTTTTKATNENNNDHYDDGDNDDDDNDDDEGDRRRKKVTETDPRG